MVAIEMQSMTLPASTSAPARARAWLGMLEGYLTPERLADARLMVTELVTNAVLHGGLQESAPIYLTARVEPGRVRVSVCDCGDGFELRDTGTAPPGSAPTGRGLYIVNRLADRMLVDGVTGRVVFELTWDD